MSTSETISLPADTQTALTLLTVKVETLIRKFDRLQAYDEIHVLNHQIDELRSFIPVATKP